MSHIFGRITCFRRSICLALALIPLCATTGCLAVPGIRNQLQYNDRTNDFVMGWRNTVWARQSWHAHKAEFAGEPQFHTFGEGYRAGYIAVASGGNGCPPPVAPRKFWNWRYQSAEGQSQVAAWFSGYPHGARAAEIDGAGQYQQIQVSYAIEKQYSPEFLNQPPEVLDPNGTTPPTTGPNNFENLPIPQPNLPGLPGNPGLPPGSLPPNSSPPPADPLPGSPAAPEMGMWRLPAIDEQPPKNPFLVSSKSTAVTALR